MTSTQDGLDKDCGDWIICCFEDGTLSFDMALYLVKTYDPIWEIELLAAQDNIEYADTH